MKRYKRKFEEALYNLTARIIAPHQLYFYQEGNEIGTASYKIQFSTKVFGIDLYNKFERIKNLKCKFFEIDSEYDAIANFKNNALVITFEVDGEVSTRIFKMLKIIDAKCTLIV
jgi:hypothetical protein